jgi:hypothetical protein
MLCCACILFAVEQRMGRLSSNTDDQLSVMQFASLMATVTHKSEVKKLVIAIHNNGSVCIQIGGSYGTQLQTWKRTSNAAVTPVETKLQSACNAALANINMLV